jgi:hypothetical protein
MLNVFSDKFQKIRSANLAYILLGALFFGIGGVLRSHELIPPGTYRTITGPVFPLDIILMGLIGGLFLGLLSKNIKKIIILPLSGLLGGIIISCIPLVMVLGLLSIEIFLGLLVAGILVFIIAPLISLGIGIQYIKRKKIQESLPFLLFFFLSVVIIAGVMVPILFHNSILSGIGSVCLSAFIGLIFGAIFGAGVKKSKTMAVFGAAGFMTASIWYYLCLYFISEMSFPGFVITNFVASAIIGGFLTAGFLHHPGGYDATS